MSENSYTKSSEHSNKYECLDVLYSERGDGEILLDFDPENKSMLLITCIDISTLYKEKRIKAIEMAEEFSKLNHPNLLCIT